MNGPFETEQQARAAAHQVVSPEPGWSILRRDANRELLIRALGEAGVCLSAYEGRIAAWLAGWEDSTVAVIAGWIARANHEWCGHELSCPAGPDPHPESPACRAGEAVPGLDSEAWTCRGCGGQMIGQRTPDDLCGPCIGFHLAAPHSAESGDDERCCPDCDGNPHHLEGGCQDAAEGGQR